MGAHDATDQLSKKAYSGKHGAWKVYSEQIV
jgi:hypothetical protein